MIPAADDTAEQVSPTTVAVPPAPVRARKRVSRTLYLVAGAIVIAAATITVLAWPRLVAHPVTTTVKASGRIEGRDVTVAPKGIQGRIARLLVDEGDTVKEGQLLAELDVPQIEAQHEAASGSVAALDAQIAQASLDVIYTTKNSEASIAAAAAGLTSAQASVLRANAVLTNAKATYDRAVALFAAKAMSKQELDLAEMALHTSEADVAAAEKEVVRSEAALALARASADTIGLKRQQLRALQASRRSAAGRLAEAEANLAERRIIAPIDGTILSRPVEVGAVVGQGTAVFQMVDMNRLYVKVYIPEPEIAKLKLGDRADVSVDAFPGRVFAARISKIHDQAEFTPKNVETTDERLKLVFGVELTFVTPDRLLKPGMPADCIIHWTSSSTGESGHGS